MKLISWNVNGIRAAAKKGFFESIEILKPDVLCLQETKAQDDQVKEVLEHLTDYHLYMNSADKKGYSGTAILTKIKPLNILLDINHHQHDNEGRVTCVELEKYYVVTVYVPNSKRGLERLDDRVEFDAAFLGYLKELEKHKPVVVCGDFNVSHRPIDLARPKANYNKNAGFMQAEIDGMDNYLAAGFKDTFRFLYPEKTDAYTWWSYMGDARVKNVGWRIDYFLISESLVPNLNNAEIHPEYLESDHCPVSIELV